MGLKILEKDGSLATVRNEVTALHVLARQDISQVTTSKTATLLKSILGTTFYGRQSYGEMQPDFRLLAEKLLAKIQESLDETSVLHLLRDPPILNDAAKVGNVELIVMLTRISYGRPTPTNTPYSTLLFCIAKTTCSASSNR